MVFISFLAISAVSASDNVSDVIQVADDSDVVAVETDLNQDTVKSLAENDVEEDVVNVADDAPLTENGTGDVSEITIYSGDQLVSSFNSLKRMEHMMFQRLYKCLIKVT